MLEAGTLICSSEHALLHYVHDQVVGSIYYVEHVHAVDIHDQVLDQGHKRQGAYSE